MTSFFYIWTQSVKIGEKRKSVKKIFDVSFLIALLELEKKSWITASKNIMLYSKNFFYIIYQKTFMTYNDE